MYLYLTCTYTWALSVYVLAAFFNTASYYILNENLKKVWYIHRSQKRSWFILCCAALSYTSSHFNFENIFLIFKFCIPATFFKVNVKMF